MIECVVRFTAVAFHRWPGARGVRAYLADRHRHLLHIEVSVEQLHGDRELEYHDLLDFSRALFSQEERGSASCEQMAEEAMHVITRRWGDRRVMVSVFEDGECGARLSYSPELV